MKRRYFYGQDFSSAEGRNYVRIKNIYWLVLGVILFSVASLAISITAIVLADRADSSASSLVLQANTEQNLNNNNYMRSHYKTVNYKQIHSNGTETEVSMQRRFVHLDPERHVKVSDNLYHLGKRNYFGKEIEGYARIHRKLSLTNPERNINEQSFTGNCYIINSLGAYWKSPLVYGVDPTNIRGLSSSEVINVAQTGYSTWTNVLSNSDNLGLYDPDIVVDGEDLVSPDGKNELLFGSIAQGGVIAVAITWGIFSGPQQNREIVEQDIVFDDGDFDFGDASINSNKMDFQSVMTHEIGHGMGGLGDETRPGCEFVTMFGSISTGETNKRTLAAPDIEAIRLNYGQIQPATPNNSPSSGSHKSTNVNTAIYMILTLFFSIYIL